MLAWLRLLRISLGPTALADALCGMALGAGGFLGGGRGLGLLLASFCAYHGGMALNDWADRDWDRRTRPERPLPAGAIPAPVALGVGAALLLAAPLLVALAARGLAGPWAWGGTLVMGAVSLAALAYDLGPRAGGLGPALLVVCRTGNVGTAFLVARGASLSGPAGEAGASGAGGAPWLAVLAILVAYGGYLWTVSLLGRLEDGEDRADPGAPRRLVARAGRWLWVPGALPLVQALLTGSTPPLGGLAALAVAGSGWFGLWRLGRQPGDWEPTRIQAAMGALLRRLLIFTAAASLGVGGLGGWLAGGLVLLGYPLSWSLRRVVPPS